MPQYHTDLWAALVTLVGATWPEVKPNGIYRSREMARIDWASQASDRGFPLCVIDLAPVPTEEWGAANRMEIVTVTLNRIVGAADLDDASGLLEALEELRTALWPDDGVATLTCGQVLEYPAITDSMGLPMNQYFLTTAKPCYGGACVAKILVGQYG